LEREHIAGNRRTTFPCHCFTYQHTSNTKNKDRRKEVSPSVTEVSTEDFQVYRKRDKTSQIEYLLKEGEM
jgi:hypothetical protein